MSDWKQRARVHGDVALFQYASDTSEGKATEVFVWDLDKTYLDTRIDSLSGLFQVIVEKAFQKKNIPGTSTLVRAIRSSWRSRHGESEDFPIYFITASPPQLERKIYSKLNHDGIYPYGMFFKDNLKNLWPSRFWRLRNQVGYKVQALLQLRLHLHENVKQILWGDDSESDTIIYSLYSDICSRRLQGEELRSNLMRFRVVEEQIRAIQTLQSEVPENDPVDKIYINLAEDTDSDYYMKFGRRVVPTANALQTAIDLFQDRRIDLSQALNVAEDLIQNYSYSPDQLEASVDDLIRRPTLGREAFEKLKPDFVRIGVLRPSYEPSVTPKEIPMEERGHWLEQGLGYEPWVPAKIDYHHDYR